MKFVLTKSAINVSFLMSKFHVRLQFMAQFVPCKGNFNQIDALPIDRKLNINQFCGRRVEFHYP